MSRNYTLNMRTTIRMNDNLMRQAKIEAARKHISLTAFIEEAVEQKLHAADGVGTVSDFEIITYGRCGLNKDVDLNDSAALLDTMEE